MSIQFVGAVAGKGGVRDDTEMGLPAWGIVLEIAGMCCWVGCFVWMYRISARQDEMLKKLQEQAKRIADLSEAEHELIKEVHPQVGEIHESIKEVAEAMATESPDNGDVAHRKS